MNWKDEFPKEDRYFETENGILYCGDSNNILKKIPDNKINLIVTSPPYNKGKKSTDKPVVDLRSDSSWKGAYIIYDNFDDDLPEEEYQLQQKNIVKEMVRILKNDGSIFYNHKARSVNNKIITPFEWLNDFYIRQLIIWERNGFPFLSPTKFFPNTEYIFWITKEAKTPKFYRDKAIFKFEIWKFNPDLNTKHPAPFPEILPKNCILSTTDENDIVLDPYNGSGTTVIVADRLNRKWIGIDISEKYCKWCVEKIKRQSIKDLFDF